MNLGELITKLENLPPETLVWPGLGEAHSYRGFYDQISFEPEGSMPASEALIKAKAEIGSTHTGWGGGEFYYDESTPVNFAEMGCCESDNDRFSEVFMWEHQEMENLVAIHGKGNPWDEY